MRVKTFAITPAVVPSVSFACNKPVCIFAGHAFYLHAMRELLDGDDDGTPIDESKDRIFVSRVEFEHDEEEHKLCSVFCADRTFFTAALEGDSFSQEKTRVCVKMLQEMASNEKNTYCSEHKYYLGDDHLSASDFCLENFKCFLDIVKRETEKGDDRPIYVFDLFERLDEAVDISPFLDTLASLGRQVFLSVKTAYADQYLYDKVDCDKVQIVKLVANMDLVLQSKWEGEE